MRLYRFFCIIFFSIFCFSNANARTVLITPYQLETKTLNQDEKVKLKNVQYTEAIDIPQQYKGKLKYPDAEEEVHLKDVRMYFGLGGRYSLLNSVDMISDADIKSNYFNKKNNWEFDKNFNFFTSIGLYWRNGVRIEFEYSQAVFETSNYGKSFARYTGSDGSTNIFNQYLQKSGNLATITDRGLSYTVLTNNMIPLVEFSVRTYMLNFILEKSTIRSKVRPYIGVGAGLVSGDMSSLVTNAKSNVLGAQAMVGLSYNLVPDMAIIYLGYRAIISEKMEQTFQRIYDAEDFNGKTYTNPKITDSKESFRYFTHNIDLGVRFFF